MSARVIRRIGISFAMATALSAPVLAQAASAAPLAATQRIVCAPNADISDSGCGNTGIGNSGFGNNGTGNSGAGNTGVANSGVGNTGTGNSGCGNLGVANSGAGNVGVANSGGTTCTTSTPSTTPTTVVQGHPSSCDDCTSVSVATQAVVSQASSASLPLTGGNSTGPLTLAMGLLLTGAAAVTLANRRRHAMAVANGGELIPLSAAVGLLLTGRAKGSSSNEK